jgi:hypothetical protein
MRRPDSVRVPISDGDWLELKKHLTAGESRRVFSRLVKHTAMGEPWQVDPLQVDRSLAMEYLVDWSVTDADGKPVVIRDTSPDRVGSALDDLDLDSFNEITAAVNAHDKAMADERAAEKNAKDGGNVSSATSPSAA